jgi:DNA-binding protein Fis
VTVNDLPFKIDLFAEAQGNRGFLRDSLEDLEKRLITEAMIKAADNQTRASEILGMSERMLRYKLKKYDLKN